MLLLQVLTTEPITLQGLGTAVVVIGIAAKTYLDRAAEKERKSDLGQRFDDLKTRMVENHEATRDRIEKLTLEVIGVRHHLIGPDGKNGLRSKVERLEDRLDERERAERERLEAQVGRLDRRNAE